MQKCGKLRRKSVAIATKTFGREKKRAYDADAICATKNRGKVRRTFGNSHPLLKPKTLRRTFIDIATPPVGFKKKNLHETLDLISA
jgi:hypothetical protein